MWFSFLTVVPVSTEANTLTIPGFQTPPSDPPADLIESAPEPPTMSCLVFDAQTLQAECLKLWLHSGRSGRSLRVSLKHAALCLGKQCSTENERGVQENLWSTDVHHTLAVRTRPSEL